MKNRNKSFWEWFANHEKDFFDFEKNQVSLFDLLQNQLAKIDPNITFEFSSKKRNNKREMVISAGGIKKSFDSVLSLVKDAPELKMFEVIAFRPRLRGYSQIKYEDLILNIGDIFFEYRKNQNKLDIILYIKNYKSNVKYDMATYLLLDMLLGEYDTEEKIGSIDKKRLQNVNDGLLPISELPNIVDNLIK